MSPELTAHTGLDALSYAIESCVSEVCDFLSRRLAIAARPLSSVKKCGAISMSQRTRKSSTVPA